MTLGGSLMVIYNAWNKIRGLFSLTSICLFTSIVFIGQYLFPYLIGLFSWKGRISTSAGNYIWSCVQGLLLEVVRGLRSANNCSRASMFYAILGPRRETISLSPPLVSLYDLISEMSFICLFSSG